MNIYYPPVVFAIIHSVLCLVDDIYNFKVKRMIQSFSLLGLAVIFIQAILKLTSANQSSVILIGVEHIHYPNGMAVQPG